MRPDTHIDELLLRWEQLQAQGQMLSAEALCLDYPEYQEELARRIRALQAMGDVVNTNTVQGSRPTASELEVAPLAAIPADMLQVIGRFRVEKILGEGGFGRVYLAHDEQLSRPVAIKVPHAYLVTEAGNAEAYLTEARTVANLDHPNIVPVYDVGSSEQFPCFVVSKYIDGIDLASRLRQSRLALHEAVELTATVAEALHHAHKQELVHRDIKPGNILLDKSGKPFVADFGLALREQDVGKGPRYAGTPAYMSPEQARGEGHRVDGRSDIFSLGVVLYELLTGRRPFKADTVKELLKQIVSLEARPCRQIDDRIPKELDRICLKALAKRTSVRYSTAKDMADDLRHFLAEASVEEKSVVTGREKRKAETGTPMLNPVPTASDHLAIAIMPKGLRSFDAGDADFFLQLLPGPRDREGLPESIRYWKTRIEESDPDSTIAVGLIYGPSGCGKSSLVKAGLLPRLAKSVTAVYVEATAEETEARLLKGLRRQIAHLPGDLSLVESLTALRRGRFLESGQKVLLVLDQFEQWLHAKRGEANTELVQALRQCDGDRVQCIVLVRDDFWLAVSRFMNDLEVELLQGRNVALVDLFDPRHARKVLTAFGRAFGALVEQPQSLPKDQTAFLDQAVAGLVQDGKVIPVRLALFAEMVKGKPWTPATLKEVGGTEGVRVTFLEETFAASTAPPQHRLHQNAAQAVLRALLPEAGTDIKGHMRSQQALLEASGYASRPRDFDDLLRILDRVLRLITPTDPEGMEGERSSFRAPTGAKYYQLTHDYLVPSLRDWLTRKQKQTRQGRAELRLAERAGAWNAKPQNRQLPAWWEWASIGLFTQKRHWTTPQRKMMRKATRFYGVRGLVLTALAILALTGFGLYKADHAAGLVRQLLAADIAYVPAIIEEMQDYRLWTDPLLRQIAVEAEKEHDPRKQLRVSLALLPVESRQFDYLYQRLPNASPEELPVIRNALQGQHQPELLADLLMDGDDKQFAVLFPRLKEHPERGRTLLLAEVDKYLPADAKEKAKENLAKRQANAAVALFRMGQEFRMGQDESVWLLLKHRPDPRVRSYLIHRLGPMGVESRAILKQLDVEKEVSVGRALLLSLGEFDLNYLPVAVRDAALPKLLELYRTDADPGLHAAAEWLLRQWRQDEAVKQINQDWGKDSQQREQRLQRIQQELANDKDKAKPQWYVNGQGQTMVVLPGPVEFETGSPLTEAGRLSRVTKAGGLLQESPHRRRIGRAFAIATKPVTVEQLLRFRKGHRYLPQWAPTNDCPVHGTSWYVAAAYCNWLSEQEGLPEKEWCYQPTKDGGALPVLGACTLGLLGSLQGQGALLAGSALFLGGTDGKDAEGMKLAPDYLKRSGYRLPTEAEWEYACRAGAVTSRYYGESEELLGKYGWYENNSANRSWPVGMMKPNDFGLFDMHGNVWTWCGERFREYADGKDAKAIDDNEDSCLVNEKESRVLRAGSFNNPSRLVRSASRTRYVPSPINTVGIRPARTFTTE